MSVLEALDVVRRRWRIAAACLLVGVAAALLTVPERPAAEPAVYKATHVLVYEHGASTGADETPGLSARLSTWAFLVTHGDVPARSANALGAKAQPASLATNVRAKADPERSTLSVTAEAGKPDRAVALADTFALELLGYLEDQAERQYEDSLFEARVRVYATATELAGVDGALALDQGNDILKAQKAALVSQYTAQYERARQLESRGVEEIGLETIEPASPVLARSEQRPSTRVTLRLAVALLASAALGLGACLLVERLDPRLQTRRAARNALGLPILAEIQTGRRRSSAGDVVMHARPASAAADAYRFVRSSVLATGDHEPGRDEHMREARHPASGSLLASGRTQVILVAPASRGAGASAVTANLAVCLAETGASVLVIDADVRSPGVHARFGVALRPGLSDLVDEDPQQTDLRAVIQRTNVTKVWVATAGAPVANLGRYVHLVRTAVRRARRMADFVLISTAPALDASDLVDLAPNVDAVLVVARTRVTTHGEAVGVSELVSRLGVPVLGAVLTTTKVASSVGERPEASGSWSAWVIGVHPAPPVEMPASPPPATVIDLRTVTPTR